MKQEPQITSLKALASWCISDAEILRLNSESLVNPRCVEEISLSNRTVYGSSGGDFDSHCNIIQWYLKHPDLNGAGFPGQVLGGNESPEDPTRSFKISQTLCACLQILRPMRDLSQIERDGMISFTPAHMDAQQALSRLLITYPVLMSPAMMVGFTLNPTDFGVVSVACAIAHSTFSRFPSFDDGFTGHELHGFVNHPCVFDGLTKPGVCTQQDSVLQARNRAPLHWASSKGEDHSHLISSLWSLAKLHDGAGDQSLAHALIRKTPDLGPCLSASLLGATGLISSTHSGWSNYRSRSCPEFLGVLREINQFKHHDIKDVLFLLLNAYVLTGENGYSLKSASTSKTLGRVIHKIVAATGAATNKDTSREEAELFARWLFSNTKPEVSCALVVVGTLTEYGLIPKDMIAEVNQQLPIDPAWLVAADQHHIESAMQVVIDQHSHAPSGEVAHHTNNTPGTAGRKTPSL